MSRPWLAVLGGGLLLVALRATAAAGAAVDWAAMAATLDPSQQYLEGWNNSADPCADQFKGIMCWNGTVTAIDLHSGGLTGQIPPQIGDVATLTSLDLSSNALNGPVPTTIGNLAALQTLHLCCQELTGSIPEELGSLSQLHEIITRHRTMNTASVGDSLAPCRSHSAAGG